MFQPVTLPLWAFILILLFAAVTFASNFLFPSVRWFFRKRAERVIARLNERLTRPIEPFKLARRYDMIQRLIYDPEVTKAILQDAAEHGTPENVSFEKAQRYAKEIVPSFSATAYFTIGMRLAKFLGDSFYRMRIGAFDRDELEAIEPDAAVVFVINHRSNMDYVLVTYLVSRAGALSYAVGEWARVWPLSGLIRMMGAYFIRRRSRGQLYRKVLARYVQMATRGGVTQAMFPEGGLSVTGAPQPPKMGLLSYILDDFDPTARDVIFVPVGVNYDRVIEDRFLVKADQAGKRKFRPPFPTILRGIGTYLYQRVTWQMRVFGTASVGFGTPLRLSDVPQNERSPEAVAEDLMKRISEVIPVLSVPLVAYVLSRGARTEADIKEQVRRHLSILRLRRMPLPRRDADAIVVSALDRFRKRGFIEATGEGIVLTQDGEGIITYYANTIAHHFDGADIG